MTNLKAYMTIFKADGTREKAVWSLEEAKNRLKAKDFEKLCTEMGLNNKKMRGYVAY